uniref:Uncharacterized protein n=1 Tax=Arundo donax TaxID=35708 RepID=A0A0A9BIT2_ARUDO
MFVILETQTLLSGFTKGYFRPSFPCTILLQFRDILLSLWWGSGQEQTQGGSNS